MTVIIISTMLGLIVSFVSGFSLCDYLNNDKYYFVRKSKIKEQDEKMVEHLEKLNTMFESDK